MEPTTTMDQLEQFKKDWQVYIAKQPQPESSGFIQHYPRQGHPCPSCGYCPHCGRGGNYWEPYKTTYSTPVHWT